MLRAPHLAHPAGAQSLLETIAAQLPRACDLGAEAVDHARADIREQNDEQVRQDEDEEEPDADSSAGTAGLYATTRPMTIGTELTENSAATSALRGGLGTMTV